MKKRVRYVIGEIKAIGLFALIPSMLATYLSVGWWWYQPYGTGAAVMFGSFAVFAVIGVLGSLHDDYRVLVFIERRHDR